MGILRKILRKKEQKFTEKRGAMSLNTGSNLEGNLRDYADVTQLICLANLESLNAEFIRQKLSQSERLLHLNEIAIVQMKSLLGNGAGNGAVKKFLESV